MAALTATRQHPWLDIGAMTGAVFEVTSGGSAGHVVTGLKYIWFAMPVSETASGATDQVVFNSNDGTAGTLNGSVYLAAEDDTDVLQLLVIGW